MFKNKTIESRGSNNISQLTVYSDDERRERKKEKKRKQIII